MKAVIQRVKSAKVIIRDFGEASICNGLVLILAIGENDNENELSKMIELIINLKIFEGSNSHLSNSLKETNYEILLISQFTLYSNIQNDYSIKFQGGASTRTASKLFEFVSQELTKLLGDRVKIGKFGAYMNVILDNDGPVTIIL
jgi:D-tyrosyl-tRNA(Tyr) deacylase